jgi:hypothetical protein
MRPGMCMECGTEYCRVTEKHEVVDCLNKMRAEILTLKKALNQSIYIGTKYATSGPFFNSFKEDIKYVEDLVGKTK